MEEEILHEIMVEADVEEDETEMLLDADVEEENIAVIQESENVMVDDEVMNEAEILVDADVREENIAVIQDGSVECTCRHFLRFRFLCRHAFCALKNCDVQMIPEKYILRRWRRDIIPPSLRRNTNRCGEKNIPIEKLKNEATFVLDECLYLLGKDEGKLGKFVEQLKSIKKGIEDEAPKPPSRKKEIENVLEDVYAVKKPKKPQVKNPSKASTKGWSKEARRKSGREIALEEHLSGKRNVDSVVRRLTSTPR
ncbi:FAR1 DNA binding domain-containing protein [Artemisia annua]|uniref:FAR1 DNA binding domain-containing protein n=1 Tax=Artemisia annua TaxID=35608 RepID=A0A2U1LMS8_ARTAN|nr:FAR1 DNA binding domain-containing protein [Artemisia annua]